MDKSSQEIHGKPENLSIPVTQLFSDLSRISTVGSRSKAQVCSLRVSTPAVWCTALYRPSLLFWSEHWKHPASMPRVIGSRDPWTHGLFVSFALHAWQPLLCITLVLRKESHSLKNGIRLESACPEPYHIPHVDPFVCRQQLFLVRVLRNRLGPHREAPSIWKFGWLAAGLQSGDVSCRSASFRDSIERLAFLWREAVPLQAIWAENIRKTENCLFMAVWLDGMETPKLFWCKVFVVRGSVALKIRRLDSSLSSRNPRTSWHRQAVKIHSCIATVQKVVTV